MLDSPEYQEFYKIMVKKLRRVVKTLEKSTLSYKDAKAEKVLSDALATVKNALKKNKDILLLEGLPLFSRRRVPKMEEQQAGGVLSAALADGKSVSEKLDEQEIIKLASPKNMETAFDWHGRLIRDAFLSIKTARHYDTA